MTREKILAELRERMESLYKTGDYFVAVPPGETPSYEKEYWDEVVDPDGKRRSRLSEREQYLEDLRAERAFIRALTAGRMLDLGCGPGWLLSAVDPRWERHGLEVSAFAAAEARAHATVHVGPLTADVYPEQWFDLVVMHHVIEHVPDPVSLISLVRRVLQPGGHLVLGTPDFDSGCARLFGARYRLLHDATHISLFSSDSMHRFLRDHGFAIERVDYPFFETRHFTRENVLRLFATESVSPPFYGNFMTFYARAK